MKELVIKSYVTDKGGVVVFNGPFPIDKAKQVAALCDAAPDMLVALNKISAWLVCSPVATAEDMAQSFPEMLQIAEVALAKAIASEPNHTKAATLTVSSSHGQLTVDDDGYVIECRTDTDDADGGAHLNSITRFDLIEWRKHWGIAGSNSIDILDLGYLYTDPKTNETAYAPPDADWRAEIAQAHFGRIPAKAMGGAS